MPRQRASRMTPSTTPASPPLASPAPDALLAEVQPTLIWTDPYDPEAKRAWITLFLLLGLTIATYVPALSADFLWRDDQTVTANESIRSFRTVAHMWLHPRSVSPWRPVADL